MSAFCCILFYLILICYHVIDFFFDWYTFAVLLQHNKFSGVSMSKSEVSMIQIPFGLSCVTGTIFSVVMIVAYIYYIKHHCHCMKNASLDRQLVNFELWVSVLELFLKDIIQSVILFWAYVSKSSATSNPASMSIVFSVCSIAAHLKLCLCFLTKLCGWGTGEERCGEHTVMKALSCIYGFEGSAICLILTAVAFSIEVN